MMKLLAGVLVWAWAGVALAVQGYRVRSVTVTPAITGTAYAQGDQMGTAFEVPGAFIGAGVELQRVVVVDKTSTKADFDVMFFSKTFTPTSADNAAVSLTDAVVEESYAGKVAVVEADFTTLAVNAVASKAAELQVPAKGGLYALLVCSDSGGCDYSSTDDLVLRFVFVE